MATAHFAMLLAILIRLAAGGGSWTARATAWW